MLAVGLGVRTATMSSAMYDVDVVCLLLNVLIVVAGRLMSSLTLSREPVARR